MNLRGRVILAAALLALALSGCGRNAPEQKPVKDDGVLTILAADELRDLEPLMDEIAKAAGQPVTFHYTGSLQVVDRLVKGEDTDLAWPAGGGYLALFPDAKSPALAQEKVMRSPVVVGVKESLAAEWGWTGNPNLTWRDVAERAAAGDLKFAMSAPSSDQAGLSALLGLSAALHGRPDPLGENDLAPQMGRLGAFLSGQALTAPSGELAGDYLNEQDRLNGIIDYESNLLRLNRSPRLNEKLALVYPREGIVTADYPLLLINPAQREAYHRLTAFLRSPDVQRRLMEITLRRPADPSVGLSSVFPAASLAELPFPTRRTALDRLRQSKPLTGADLPAPGSLSLADHARHLIFVVDVSASMRGSRLDELKSALLAALPATGQGLARVTIVAYNHEIAAQSSFDIDPARPETLQGARAFVLALSASGGTASYDALRLGYEAARRARKMEPVLLTRVILITDGAAVQGMTEGKFIEYFRKASDAQDVPTQAVVLGEGRAQDFEAIASETGGSVKTSVEGKLKDTLLGLLEE